MKRILLSLSILLISAWFVTASAFAPCDPIDQPHPDIIFPENCFNYLDTLHPQASFLPNFEKDPCLAGDPREEGCVMTCDSTILTYFAVQTPGSIYQWQVQGGTIIGPDNLPDVAIEWGDLPPASIKLIEMNGAGCVDSIEYCIEFMESPTANFSSSIACLGTATQFTDLSIDADEWHWNFGDGNTSDLQNPAHVFSTPGTHNVCLVVSNYHQDCWFSFPDHNGDGSVDPGQFQEIPCKTRCVCTDTIKMDVFVDPLIGPDISCVSTVCVNDEACYYTSATCSSYVWNVSLNGTIVSGGGPTDDFVCVVWNAGAVGSLSLEVPGCSPPYCTTPTTVTVPIIDDATLMIEGDNPACASEVETYSVPKYPGAVYDWTVITGGMISSPTPYSNSVDVAWFSGSTFGQITVTISHPYLEDGTGNCTATDTLDVDLRPKYSLSGPQVVCVNTVHTYFGSIFGNYNWTAIGGTIVSANGSNSIDILWDMGPGSHQVIATPLIPSDFCNTYFALSVNVAPPPATPTIIGPDVVCLDGTYTYEATASPISGTFEWSAIGGTITPINATTVVVDWDPSGSYSLSVAQTFFNAPYCKSDLYTLNVNPITSLVISGANAVCPDTQENYTVTTVPASTGIPTEEFIWSIDPPTSPGTNGSVIAGQTTDNATIEWHNTSGIAVIQVEYCGLSTTYNVNITPPTPPTILGPSTICENDTDVLSVAGGCYTNYSWTNEIGGVISTGPTASITGGGCYTLSAEDCSVNNCPVTSTFCVTEIPPIDPFIYTNDDLIICLNPGPTSINFTLNSYSLPGGLNYLWEENCGGGWTSTGITTPSAPFFGVNTVCSYRLRIVDPINNCTYYSNILNTIVINDCTPTQGCQCPLGTVDFAPVSPICNPVSFTNISTAATNFNWSFGDGSSYSGATPPPHTYSFPGFYDVCLTGEVPNCLGSTCRLFSCRQIEVPAVIDFDYDIDCNGNIQFIDQSIISPNNSVAYNWNVTGCAPPFNSTSQNPVYSPTCGSNLNVTFSITTVNSITGDVCTLTQTETIIQPSNLAVFSTSTPACLGEEITFTDLTTGIVVASWLWDFGDLASSTLQYPTHTYTSTGSFTVTLSITDSKACVHTSTQTINVQPLPGPITLTAIPSDACEGSAVTLTAPIGYSNYVFTNTTTGVSTPPSPSNTHTVFESGIYIVQLEHNITGCVNKSDQVVVTIYPNPPAVIDGDTELCLGETTTLTGPPGYTYLWSNGSTSQSVFVPILPAGSHPVTLEITDTSSPLGCKTVVTTVINVYPEPSPPFVITSSSPICDGDLVTYAIASPDPSFIYNWSNGQSGTSITIVANGPISVTASDMFGCSATSVVDACPLPDVCIFPEGCYTRCKPDTICIPNYYSGYQWLKDGLPIAGATDTCFIATMDGEYQVILKNDWGCVDTTGVLDLTLIDCCEADCDSLEVFMTPIQVDTGECCYEVGFENNYCNPIVSLEASVITPGWQFNTGSININGSWNGIPDPYNFKIDYNSGNYPTGIVPNLFDFCLAQDGSIPSPPTTQQIEFSWHELSGNDTIVKCDTILLTHCENPPPSDCADLRISNVECDSIPNVYKVEFYVTNNNPTYTATNLLLYSPMPSGISFRTTPGGANVTSTTIPISIPPFGTGGPYCIYIHSATPITSTTNVFFNFGLINSQFCCHPVAPVSIQLDPCECLLVDVVDFDCEEDKYTLTLDITNKSQIAATATGFFVNVINSGVTITPPFIDWSGSPLPLNGTRTETFCITPQPITDPFLILEYTIHHSLNFPFDSCCTSTVIDSIPIPDCDPCEDVSASYTPTDECCYAIDLQNNLAGNYFTSIQTEIINSGNAVFGTKTNDGNWTFNDSAPFGQTNLEWIPSSGFVPLGNSSLPEICFGSILDTSTDYPQTVLVKWMVGDEIECIDTLVFHCEQSSPCLEVLDLEVICDPDKPGSYTLSYVMCNHSGYDLYDYHFYNVDPASVSITPVYSLLPPLLDGTCDVFTFTVSGGNPGDVVTLFSHSHDGPDPRFCCVIDPIIFTLPDCGDCCKGTYDEFLHDHINPGFILSSGANHCYSILIDPVALDGCMEVVYDWGDGTSSGPFSGNNASTSHIYPGPGNYYLCMIVREIDDQGNVCWEDKFCRDVTIPDCPFDCDYSCISNVDFTYLNTGVFNSFQFYPNVGIQLPCTVTGYEWTFYGGFPSTSTAPNPVVSFPTTGFYSATLLVYFTDQYGNVCEIGISKQFYIGGIIVIGVEEPVLYECFEDVVHIGPISIPTGTIGANVNLTSVGYVEEGKDVELLGGKSVELGIGSEVQIGSRFLVDIEACESEISCCGIDVFAEPWFQVFYQHPSTAIHQGVDEEGNCIFEIYEDCMKGEPIFYFDCFGDLICESVPSAGIDCQVDILPNFTITKIIKSCTN